MSRGRPLAAAVAAVLAIGPVGGAHGDWRDEATVLRLGVVADGGARYTQQRLEGFRNFLSARIELPVELVTFDGYRALIEAQAGGRVDYAIHTAASFVAAGRRCRCVEPVAAPLAFDGSPGFHALLVARSGGPVRTPADAEGQRVAVTGPDSVAGRLAPLSALREAGLDPQADVALVDAADPEDALTMLFTGEADLAVAWGSMAGDRASGYSFGVLKDLVAAGALDMDDVEIVWQSPLIPFGPHAIRTDAPAELKLLLLDSLTSLAGEAPGILDRVDRSATGGGGFARIGAADYAFVDSL